MQDDSEVMRNLTPTIIKCSIEYLYEYTLATGRRLIRYCYQNTINKDKLTEKKEHCIVFREDLRYNSREIIIQEGTQ